MNTSSNEDGRQFPSYNFDLKPLPEKVRAYLREQRCISDDIIDTAKLQWLQEYKGHPWIVIPILNSKGETVDLKLRKPPESNASEKTLNLKGSSAKLYGEHYISNSDQEVVLCEGELDALALHSLGITAVTSTTGVSTFKEEWLSLLPKNIQCTICFDSDEAGKKGSEKVAKLIRERRRDIPLWQLVIPDDLGKGGDVTDLLLRCKATQTDAVKTLEALKEPYMDAVDIPHQPFEVASVNAPSKPTNYLKWCEKIKDDFPELLIPAKAGLSVMTQMLIKDISNCFALVLVDVPSSGKTITLNFFDDIPSLSYSTDSFTPASFVSNAANVKKEKLPDIDLLPRIRRKMVLLRDMGTIFSDRDDDLMKNLGILTRVLDGEGYATETGIHGRRSVKGDYVFGLFAATTPLPLRVWKVMGTLGQRIFFLNLHSDTKTEEELANQLRRTSYKARERECRQITQDFLRTIWQKYPNGVEWDREKDPVELLRIISRSALLLSRLRGQVIVYRDKWEGDEGEELTHTVPLVEKPDRINQCLYNFARGHAVSCLREQLNSIDIGMVIRLVFDSAPNHRAPLFQELLKRGGQMKTSEVQDILACSKPTALKEMKTLCILDVCEYIEDEDSFNLEKRIRLKEDLHWFTTDECQQYLKYCERTDSVNITDFLHEIL